MKYFNHVLIVILVFIQACKSDVKKSEVGNFQLIDEKRCEFKLAPDLMLKEIDTTKFDKDGYFKIYSKVSNSMMQIFVFNTEIDAAEKVADEKSALNTPEVFTANTFNDVTKFGHYTGTGLIMDGYYKGGIVKGKIKVFAYSTSKSAFLIIRQIINTDESSDDFDKVENSFILK